MTNITLKDCIVGVWRDVLMAPQRMPFLSLFAFALTLAALAFVHWFNLAVGHGDAVPGVLADIGKSRYLRASFQHLGKIATVVVAVPLIRSAAPGLLHGDASKITPYLRYALLWLVFINLGVVLGFFIDRLKDILPLIGVSNVSIAATVRTARLMTFIGVMYLAGRLVLVFAHVALGGRFEWRAAWRDTNGQFLAVAAVYFFAGFLPTQITGEGVFPALTARVPSVPVALIIATFFCLIAIYVGALSIAWIYKRFARRIIAETRH